VGPTRSADPLEPRWALSALTGLRAGAGATGLVELENAGSATWRSVGAEGLQLSHHWLDERGNAIVWDGPRTPFRRPVGPGERVSLEVALDVPRRPGRYVLRFDLVEEHRFWLSEVGVATLDVPVEVEPRIRERRLGVVVHGGGDGATHAALAAQEEAVVEEGATAIAHLVAGAEPAPDWSRLLLDAHAEGWTAVGPSLVPTGPWLARRRAAGRLAAWAPGGRNPRFGSPLLLPSIVAEDGAPEVLVSDGLPTVRSAADTLFEGRALVRLPTRSGRPSA
jgi:hypothetical protein